MKIKSLVFMIVLLLSPEVAFTQKPTNTFKPKEGNGIDMYLRNNGVFDLLWDKSDEVFVVTIQKIELNLFSTNLSYHFTITAKIEERFKWNQVLKDSTVVRFTETVSWSHGINPNSLLSSEKKYIVFLSNNPGWPSNTTELKGIKETIYSLVDITLGIQELNPRLYDAVHGKSRLEHWIDR